jgi:hypothetical protein
MTSGPFGRSIKQALDSTRTDDRRINTKDRIRYAAEELFTSRASLQRRYGRPAARTSTSRRSITTRQGNLVNEVFRRRMTTWPRGPAALQRGRHPGELEPILAAFVEPALAMAQDRHGGGAFIRVIARAYAESNDSLRKFLSDQYGHVLRDFAKALAGCMPGLGKEALYWRLDFLSGA